MIATTAVAAGMVVFGVVNFLGTAEKLRVEQLHENKMIEAQIQYKEDLYIKERPFILVQKFGRTDNFNYIRILSTSLTRQSLRSGESAVDKIKELVNALTAAKIAPSKAPLISAGIYNQIDHPSTLLFLILRQMYNSVLWGKNASVIVRSLQKLGSVVYAQVIIKENNLNFDNNDEDHLWIVREFILFPFRDDFMMISTYVPTTTPAFNDGYFTDVNAWILAFYLAEF
jgi:hypothetical protein